MSYSYDDQNRLSTVIDNRLPAGPNTTAYTYDGDSNLYTATYSNGVKAQYSYDTMNRVTGLAASSPAAEVSGYTYQLWPAGNLKNVTELNGRSVSWSFDGIYRLTNEAVTGDANSKYDGSAGYGLDPVGNRTSASATISGLAPISGNYNQDDELTGEGYDANGNVTSSGGKLFAYDSQNELVSMNGGAVQMLYDGDGNRVAKSVTANGVTTITRYLVDDLNPTGLPQVMDELNGSGVVTRTYAYGLQRIDEDQIVNNAWTPSFYNYDGTDSVRQLTNVSGTVTDTYEYDAFGNEISSTGTTPNNYLYRGEQWDPDLGLYYLRARYYDPMTDRFLSRDPGVGDVTTPATLHKYLYADGDPVNGADPTGWQDAEAYTLTLGRISLSDTVVTGLKVASAAIACDLVWEGTKTHAETVAGPFGTVVAIAPCVAMGIKPGAPPMIPPLPLPQPLPQSPQKSPRCQDLNAIVDGIKATIGASGGSCSASLTPSQNYARLALWVAYLNARLDERAECSQYDPNPAGHQQQIDQIWTNIIKCEVILHEF
jgi:RHS repeat-associated protein